MRAADTAFRRCPITRHTRWLRRAVALGSLLLALGMGSPGAAAQDRFVFDPLVPDRPGSSEGSFVMAPGAAQLEAGYHFVDADDVVQHRIGQALVRLGLVGPLELRLGFNSYVIQRDTLRDAEARAAPAGRDLDASGLEDFTLGLKLRLYERSYAPFRASLLVRSTLPTGDEAFGADEARPEARLIIDQGLTAWTGLTLNVGYQAATDDGEEDLVIVSGALGAVLASAERFGVFVGYEGRLREGPDVHLVETGLTYLAGNDVQFDVNGGLGISDAAPNFFLGLGFARRF